MGGDGGTGGWKNAAGWAGHPPPWGVGGGLRLKKGPDEDTRPCHENDRTPRKDWQTPSRSDTHTHTHTHTPTHLHILTQSHSYWGRPTSAEILDKRCLILRAYSGFLFGLFCVEVLCKYVSVESKFAEK